LFVGKRKDLFVIWHLARRVAILSCPRAAQGNDDDFRFQKGRKQLSFRMNSPPPAHSKCFQGGGRTTMKYVEEERMITTRRDKHKCTVPYHQYLYQLPLLQLTATSLTLTSNFNINTYINHERERVYNGRGQRAQQAG
jgi:hypothetical protein